MVIILSDNNYFSIMGARVDGRLRYYATLDAMKRLCDNYLIK